MLSYRVEPLTRPAPEPNVHLYAPGYFADLALAIAVATQGEIQGSEGLVEIPVKTLFQVSSVPAKKTLVPYLEVYHEEREQYG